MAIGKNSALIILVGTAVFLVQAIFSQIYFLERTACYDPAFFSFLMLDSGSLESVLGRHGSWLSQLLPWAVLKTGGTLEQFLRAYSISFILLYYLFFLITVLLLKDDRAGLAMVLTCTVGYHFSFYYATAELYQGLALCCMLWALLRWLRTAQTAVFIGGSVLVMLLTVWISFYHQLLIIPVLFLLLYQGLLNRGTVERNRWIVTYSLVLGWMVVRVLFFEKSSYELARMVTLDDFKTHLPYLYKLPSTLFFRAEFDELPALALSILLAGLLLLLCKKWLLTGLYSAFMIGFFVLIMVTDHAGQSPVMYENYYTVFGFFAAIVLAHSLFTIGNKRRVQMLSLGIGSLLVLGLVQIEKGHRPFSVIVDHYQKSTERMVARGMHKAVYHVDNHPWMFSWMSWPTPFTSILVSAVLNDGNAATLYPSSDPARTLREHTSDNAFLGPEWEPTWFTSDNLHPWVKTPEMPYVNMTTISSGDDRGKLRAHISLKTERDTIFTDHGPKTYVPVTITNTADDTLHARLSDGGMLRLFYWIDEGEGFVRSGQLSALDSDVYPGESVQFYLIVNRPAKSGFYPIKCGLYSGHEYVPWEVETKFVLHKK